MIDVSDLQAKAGQPIRPLWNKLVTRLRSAAQIQAGRGVRVHQGPEGTAVVASGTGGSYTPRFLVGISGKEATIGLGTVNGLVPTINGIALDGITASGATVTVPHLKLTAPNAQLRSWIVVQVQIDPESKVVRDDVEDAITLLHTDDLKAVPGDDFGWHPVGLITWADRRTPQRAWNVTKLDLTHVYLTGSAGQKGRHFFSGV